MGHTLSNRYCFFFRDFIFFRLKSSNLTKGFLTALAIIDDLGAILIIAFFYSGDLSIPYLSLILLSYILLFLILNKFSIKVFTPYLIVGLLMWFFTYKSGIHATIAGVLLASTIPHRKKEKDFSLLMKIEHAISAYVAFLIMPIFAFANAGVSLTGLSLLKRNWH